METAQEIPPTVDEFALPVARIIAENQLLVDPVREYLATRGCKVLVNTASHQPTTYMFIIGSLDFVKSIAASTKFGSQRSIAIVLSGSNEEAKALSSTTLKIYQLEGGIFPIQVIERIFSFFFSDQIYFSEKPRNRHEPPPNNIPSHIVSDSDRVERLLNQEFGVRDRTSKNSQHLKKRNRDVLHTMRRLFVFFVLILLVPFFWHLMSLTASFLLYRIVYSEFQRGSSSNINSLISAGEYWAHQADVSLSIISPIFRFAGAQAFVRQQERIISLSHETGKVFRLGNIVLSKATDVAAVVSSKDINQTGVTPLVEVGQLLSAIRDFNGALALLSVSATTLLNNRAFPFSMVSIQESGRDAILKIQNIRQALETGEHLLSLFPSVAGFREPATYLLLLQNSNELRATGGFIGSIAIVRVENGRIVDYKIRDVYEVDGQLKGHVDPPVPIRDMLAQEHWYLRDSNWNPDFSESGQKAAWFYQKETGESVTGVVAISLPVVVDLLRVTGPITLSDYRDQITAENFFGKSLYYTQEGSFPGSTQKSDFLGTLSRSMIETLATLKPSSSIDLFRAVSAGLRAKNIQLYMADSDVEALVRQFAWGGALPDATVCTRVSKGACIADPVSIVDTNMSVSKVNYFVQKTTRRELSVDAQGNFSEIVSLVTRNTAHEEVRGVSGHYQSYVRFFLPDDASIDRVLIDGQPVRAKNVSVIGPQALPYVERGREAAAGEYVGIAWEVPMGSTNTIRVEYRRPHVISSVNAPFSIALATGKQAGVPDREEQVHVRIPQSWHMRGELLGEPGSAAVVAKAGQLEYNTVISQDRTLILAVDP